MTNFLLSTMGAFGIYAKDQFVRQTKVPIAAQERFLRELLRIQHCTELGCKFGLGDVQTIDQFRDRVPLWSYSDYEPYLPAVRPR